MDRQYGKLFRNNSQGYALASALVVILIFVTIGVAGTLYSVLDLKGTSHYHRGNQALFAAEAGAMRALAAINEGGVTDFEADVVDRWEDVFGTGQQKVNSSANGDATDAYYQVTVAADPSDPTSFGLLTIVGSAPGEARRAIQVSLHKQTLPAGALYVPPGGSMPAFGGDFEIDGSDHDENGDPTCLEGKEIKKAKIAKVKKVKTVKKAKIVTDVLKKVKMDKVKVAKVKKQKLAKSKCMKNPGIVTKTKKKKDKIVKQLAPDQLADVMGDGQTPSVGVSEGPSPEDIDRFVDHILAGGNTATITQNDIDARLEVGTFDDAQVTQLTDPGVVTLDGQLVGSGILIVEGSLVVNGHLEFDGWVIVKGDLTINGTADLLGSVWASNFYLGSGALADFEYCSVCLEQANAIVGLDGLYHGGNIPRKMTITSWRELY